MQRSVCKSAEQTERLLTYPYIYDRLTFSCGKVHRTWNVPFYPFSGIRSSGLEHFHNVVQLSPVSRSRTFPSPQNGNTIPGSCRCPFLLYPSPSQPKRCFLSLCLFWAFHKNGIVQYVTFSVWFLSLSIRFGGSERLLLGSAPCSCLGGEFYATVRIDHFWLAIPPVMDICVVSTFWLLCIALREHSWTSCVWTPEFTFWDPYVGVEFLDRMAVLCFTHRGTPTVFHREAAPPCVRANNVWCFWFFHIFSDTCYSPVFKWWSSSWVWSAVSLRSWFAFP